MMYLVRKRSIALSS